MEEIEQSFTFVGFAASPYTYGEVSQVNGGVAAPAGQFVRGGHEEAHAAPAASEASTHLGDLTVGDAVASGSAGTTFTATSNVNASSSATGLSDGIALGVGVSVGVSVAVGVRVGVRVGVLVNVAVGMGEPQVGWSRTTTRGCTGGLCAGKSAF